MARPAVSVRVVKDDRRDWDRLRDACRGLSREFVTVGLHSDAEPYERGQGQEANVAQIASFHEFGTATVPARPFMRTTSDGHREEYASMLDGLLEKVLFERMPPFQALSIVGLKVQADIRRTIREMTDPPLSPATIRRKKSSALLIDTGHMIQSIIYKVDDGTGRPSSGGPSGGGGQ